MTYSSGGLIQASDFNDFVGANLGANVSGQLNTVWGGGYGNAGYGQPRVSNVSVSGNVVATDWASLINTTNNIYLHQTGASSGLTAPTTGSIVTFLSNLASSLTTAYTNRISAATTGTTQTLNKSISLAAAAYIPVSSSNFWNIAFATPDEARYFFNAGGSIKVEFFSFLNNIGTARGSSIDTLAQTNFSSKTLYSNSFSARNGTGGTVVTDVTTGVAGYYGDAAAITEKCKIVSTSYYSSDYISVSYGHTGGTGSHGGNGSSLSVTAELFSGTTGSGTGFNDTIDVQCTFRLTVTQPNTTYLTNTWGNITIS